MPRPRANIGLVYKEGVLLCPKASIGVVRPPNSWEFLPTKSGACVKWVRLPQRSRRANSGGFRHPKLPDSSKKEYRTYRSDRKSTRLNSSHLGISYAVFCLKKKKT